MADTVKESNVTDWKIPSDMNPGITRTVVFLRKHGFDTASSGDGETHLYECDMDEAYVAIEVKPADLASEADRILAIFKAVGIELRPMGPEASEPNVQAHYDPADGLAHLLLIHVKDSMLPEVLP